MREGVKVGSVMGAVVGSIGGLFAIGIPPAIIYRSIARLLGTPVFAFISWAICLVFGWIIGGQLGSRMGTKFKSARAELIGGAIGGLLPVIAIALWSWYMTARPPAPNPSPDTEQVSSTNRIR
jgi:hypothetical protein